MARAALQRETADDPAAAAPTATAGGPTCLPAALFTVPTTPSELLLAAR